MPRLCSNSSRPYPGRSARDAVGPAMGAGLRPRPKGLDWPPDPKAEWAAPLGAISKVIGQKSAEAIVCARQRIDQEG
jgi:hypothetical protein